MDRQRFRVADVGDMAEEFQIGNQLHACLVATLETESEDRTSALRQILLVRGVIVA